MRTIFKAALAVGALAAAAAATPACAQTVTDRYWLEAQGFWPTVETEVTTSRNGGTTVNFEDDLDLSDRKAMFTVMGGFRFSKRWQMVGEYYTLDRSGSKSITRDIVFDDVTYNAGVTVGSSFDTDVYRAAVGYGFYQSDRGEMGAALGLHVTQFDSQLTGTGHIGNASATVQTRGHDALAPLPTLGFYGSYKMTDRWSLGGRVDFLSLSTGDYDGHLYNTEAGISYRLFRNLDLGIKYRYVDYELDIDKDDWQGSLNYKFSGPAVALRGVW